MHRLTNDPNHESLDSDPTNHFAKAWKLNAKNIPFPSSSLRVMVAEQLPPRAWFLPRVVLWRIWWFHSDAATGLISVFEY